MQVKHGCGCCAVRVFTCALSAACRCRRGPPSSNLAGCFGSSSPPSPARPLRSPHRGSQQLAARPADTHPATRGRALLTVDTGSLHSQISPLFFTVLLRCFLARRIRGGARRVTPGRDCSTGITRAEPFACFQTSLDHGLRFRSNVKPNLHAFFTTLDLKPSSMLDSSIELRSSFTGEASRQGMTRQLARCGETRTPQIAEPLLLKARRRVQRIGPGH